MYIDKDSDLYLMAYSRVRETEILMLYDNVLVLVWTQCVTVKRDNTTVFKWEWNVYNI